ncbi:hypothetical protein FSZ31_06740 [Sphingorhabdus soli]|uniref:Tetratricopeptide repeat protein n=1 Tax=Flavisphingopyxis soli TaxID=2601267 RepID=A0A5C6U9Z1_9SPHN|nr:hypothetical protein [Sphingorhabdus soli]TXC68676.1 hypothetical protein FSZ31_06740 [Sphingorhabdus soli]
MLALAVSVGPTEAGAGPDAPSAEARAAVNRALGYERSRDYRAARVEALNAVRADPAWSPAHIVQARVAIALGDAIAASEAIDAARESGADPASLRTLSAHAAILRGEPQEALDILSDGPGPGQAYAARLRAIAYRALGDTDSAGAALDAAVAIDPRDAATWTEISRFRLSNADALGAAEAIDRAIALDPRDIDAARIKAVLVRDRYGLIASLPWFEAALAIAPSDIDALVEYGATLGDAGRYTDMLVVLRRANALAPRDPRPLFLQAVLAARAGNYTLARSLLEKTGGQLDGQPSYMLVRGLVENSLGAHSTASNWATRLLSRQPGNEAARRLLIDASLAAGSSATAWSAAAPLVRGRIADSWDLLGAAQAYAASGQAGQPVDLIDQAAVFPGVTGAIALGERAADDTRGGDAATALPAIRRALQEGNTAGADVAAFALARAAPGVPDARIIQGDVAMAAGRTGEAATHYREALSIRVDEAATLRLVDALMRSGKRDAAIDALTGFLSTTPRAIDANRVAASFYLDARDWDHGIATLEALRARLGGRDAVILSQLGRAYLGKGQASRARDLLRAAYELQPGNAGVASLFSLALSRSGGSRKAARDLAIKAVAIESGNATYRDRLKAFER